MQDTDTDADADADTGDITRGLIYLDISILFLPRLDSQVPMHPS